jgi:hypothetical protein
VLSNADKSYISVESVCADWVINITARTPLAGLAEDGTAYNSNLPDLPEGWW